VVIPNLLAWPGSVVVLDIKRENFLATAGYRAEAGQRVLLFDPLASDGATCRFNPLGHLDRADAIAVVDELQRMAMMLFPGHDRADPFWSEAARTGFIVVGGYVAATPDLPFTLGEIFRQLTAADARTRLPRIIEARRGAIDCLAMRTRAQRVIDAQVQIQAALRFVDEAVGRRRRIAGIHPYHRDLRRMLRHEVQEHRGVRAEAGGDHCPLAQADGPSHQRFGVPAQALVDGRERGFIEIHIHSWMTGAMIMGPPRRLPTEPSIIHKHIPGESKGHRGTAGRRRTVCAREIHDSEIDL